MGFYPMSMFFCFNLLWELHHSARSTKMADWRCETGDGKNIAFLGCESVHQVDIYIYTHIHIRYTLVEIILNSSHVMNCRNGLGQYKSVYLLWFRYILVRVVLCTMYFSLTTILHTANSFNTASQKRSAKQSALFAVLHTLPNISC